MIAWYPAEPIFDIEARGREPPQGLVPATPAFDVLRMGAKLAIDRFQGVGRRQRLTESARQLQALDGHGLLHPFLQALGRLRVLVGRFLGQRLQLFQGVGGVRLLVGFPEAVPRRRLGRFGDVVEHIANLVQDTYSAG